MLEKENRGNYCLIQEDQTRTRGKRTNQVSKFFKDIEDNLAQQKAVRDTIDEMSSMSTRMVGIDPAGINGRSAAVVTRYRHSDGVMIIEEIIDIHINPTIDLNPTEYKRNDKT